MGGEKGGVERIRKGLLQHTCSQEGGGGEAMIRVQWKRKRLG